MKKIAFLIASCLCSISIYGTNLSQQIKQIIHQKRASVGVAVIHDGKTLTISNEEKYPFMSVFKFHIAIATLDKMEREHISLDDKVFIEADQMDSDTWSPLLEKHPNGRIHISYRDILEYTVSHSDNNTCNWLIDFVGGIDKVDALIRSLGISHFQLTETEKSMKEDIYKCYNNWSTPLAIAQLLEIVYNNKILSQKHFLFLEQAMLNSSSGKDKIEAGLPRHVRVAHKTGRGYRTPEGIRICDADAGVIYLPDGKKCYIVVLIKDSRESDSENAKIISDIAGAVYNDLQK